jgi:hypothetical protein
MQLHNQRIVWVLADVVLATPGTKLQGTSARQESNGARLLSLLTYGVSLSHRRTNVGVLIG